MSTLRSTAVLAALAAWAGCGGDDPLPSELLPDQLTIMRQAASAQPLETQSASVWAVKGVATTLEITYRTLLPDQGGKEFLRLDVPSDGLFIGPSGGLFQLGDSVRITVTIDPLLLLAQFEPSDLQFDPDQPARLRISYAEADHDLTGDGRVDGGDEQLRDQRLALWRQARSGALWQRIGSTHLKDVEAFEANLLRFSNYALGW